MKTIVEAARAIRAGQKTPIDLLEQCLANIDRWEKRVQAWVFVDRDGARAEARRLTEELGKGHYRGPLHGIPVGIKDIFDVFDWPTAAGSKLWAQSIARQDATVVRRLRAAGAVFVGKTVTTQWASFDPPPTRNPWNLERTPGGSSSGSAAALATGMCLGALGSQTGGSITRPASFCGVCGLKPTYDTVPVAGVVPLAPSMDHPGPMGNCVADLALMLQVIAGWGDFLPPDGHEDREGPVGPVNYLASWPRPLPSPRIGRLRGLFEDMAEPGVNQAVDQVCHKLQDKGARMAEVALPAEFAEVIPRHRVVMAVEAAVYHQPRLSKHPEDYLPRIRSLLEEGLACPAPEYARCLEHKQRLTESFCCGFPDVDILLTPATIGPAPPADTTGNPAFNSPWSYTGSPTVSLPTGQLQDGLPLAIQLVGPHGHESALLAAAAWCEQALGVAPLTPPG